MNDNHPKFLAHLRGSQPVVWHVALWLNQVKGYTVAIPPTTAAANANQAMINNDDGDLHIVGGKHENWQRVEIKERRSLQFTSAIDFPFPHLFVCATHVWDQARLKPYVFINLASDWKTAALIFGNSQPDWFIEQDVHDKRYGLDYTQNVYKVPIELVQFESIEIPANGKDGNECREVQKNE